MSRELEFPVEPKTDNGLLPRHMTIPTGWLASIAFSLVLNAGMLYQQFTTMKEGITKSDILIALMRENQIKGLAEIVNLKTDVQNHENRIVVIEKYVIQKESK
jgi:hypothetical protein